MRHFIYVCVALLVVAWGTHVVAPLYPIYQGQFALTTRDVALIAAMFGLALIPTMLVAGPLSDRWGRPTLLWCGLAAFFVGDVAFAVGAGVPWLVAGRLLQGLAMGAFFGPGAALASDLTDKSWPNMAALGVAVSSMVGFGLGPFVTGWFVQADINPTTLPFLLHAALLLVVAGLLTAALRSGPARRSDDTPSAGDSRDDPTARRLAILAGFAGWSVGGLLLVMLPTILRPVLGSSWGMLGGTALLGLMVAGAVGQITTYGWAPARALGIGALAETLGFWLLLGGLVTGWLLLILIGVLTTGLGLASLHRGGLGLVIRATAPAHKGWAISMFLACGYFGGNFLVIAFGAATDAFGMLVALTGYAAIFGVLLTVTGSYVLVRRPGS